MDILNLMKHCLSAISPQEALLMKYVAVKRRANCDKLSNTKFKVPYISKYDKLFLEYYESVLECEDIDIYATLGDIPSILERWKDLNGFIVKKYKIPAKGKLDVLAIPFKREFDDYVERFSFFDEY
jgi:hypothetical protein